MPRIQDGPVTHLVLPVAADTSVAIIIFVATGGISLQSVDKYFLTYFCDHGSTEDLMKAVDSLPGKKMRVHLNSA